MRNPITMPCLSAMAVLATLSFTTVMSTYPQIALAQTQGMQRRDERRDTRQVARTTKHECNASGQGSRAGCRQAKHAVKQTGRHN